MSRVVRAEAETALKVADAALRRAREDLDRMAIKAPFAGIIGLTNLQIGDYLAVGNPIAPLDDRSRRKRASWAQEVLCWSLLPPPV